MEDTRDPGQIPGRADRNQAAARVNQGEVTNSSNLQRYETADHQTILIKQAGKHPVDHDVALTADMQVLPDGVYALADNDAGVQRIKVTDGTIEEVIYNDETVGKTILTFLLILIVIGLIIAYISR